MKYLRNWALRGYLIWSISVDCIAIGAIIWILLPMASGLLDEPLRKPTDMVRPRPEIHPTLMEKPTQRSLMDGPLQIQQPTVLQILDPSTMKEPVGKGSHSSIFTRNGEYVSGPFYTEEEAKEVKNFLYGSLGDSPVPEYQKLGKDLNYRKTTIEGRKAPRIIEPGVEETPLKERIKEALRDIIGGTAEGLLGLIPPAEAADNPLPYVDGYTPDTFLDNWQKYYWAGEGVGQPPKEPEWLKAQKKKILQGTVFPSDVSALVSGAIDKAVDIFGGDIGKDKPRRYSADRLRNDLVNTGWIESDYVHLDAQPTRKDPNPSDSGYWQMQPLTAYDLLRSAKAHFYDPNPKKTTKFEQNFGSYHDLLKLSVDDLKKKLRDKDQQDFAAALAAVKIITTFDY